MVFLVNRMSPGKWIRLLNSNRINLPIGSVAAAMICLFFLTPRAAQPVPASLQQKFFHIDFVGSLLVLAAAITFVLAMHWAGVSEAWSSPPVIGSLVTFCALLAFFVLNEWRMGNRGMIQGHLLKKKTFVANLIFIFFLAGLYFPMPYVFPIQFQSIDNDSASHSGVRLIPLVLGISVFTMLSNALISAFHRHVPLMVVGAIAGTVGASLIYTLDADASMTKWIGYEILAAVGIGLSLQIPMISNQAAVTPGDIPAATAITLFVEKMGTALFVAAGEAAFTNKLVSSLSYNAPHLDPSVVIGAGATQLRHVVGPGDIHGVLMSYLEGCKVNHALSMACGGAATFVSLAMAAPLGVKEWRTHIHKPHVP